MQIIAAKYSGWANNLSVVVFATIYLSKKIIKKSFLMLLVMGDM